jgi:CheY-like chemotaxis protein/HPt (histidine-containing phosphotransfer) domain-containing protein
VVDVADNGRQAVESVAHLQYDAVLMDCQMPDMDGFEATRTIRQREGTARHTPIIAMTAGAMKGDEEKCLAAGMDAYLSKPVKPETLAATVGRWIHPAGAVLDPVMIAGLRDLGEPEFARLVALFLRDGATRTWALRRSGVAGDAPAMANIAHSLRGSSGVFGAAGMAAQCAVLEEMASAGDLGGATGLMDTIDAEFERTVFALRRELAPVPTTGAG